MSRERLEAELEEFLGLEHPWTWRHGGALGVIIQETVERHQGHDESWKTEFLKGVRDGLM